MKKKYKTPCTTILNIELQQMIALSATGSTDQTSGNLSRRRGRCRRDEWDDEWYDEEEEY